MIVKDNDQQPSSIKPRFGGVFLLARQNLGAGVRFSPFSRNRIGRLAAWNTRTGAADLYCTYEFTSWLLRFYEPGAAQRQDICRCLKSEH